jgi:hypothetical protein
MPNTFFDPAVWMIALGYGFKLGYLVLLESYLTKK